MVTEENSKSKKYNPEEVEKNRDDFFYYETKYPKAKQMSSFK